MANVEYRLFRVKMIRPNQRSLFSDERSSKELMDACIDARLSARWKGNSEWHIGNIQRIGESVGYFRVGKTRDGELTKFDDTVGDFLVEAAETSEFAHCVFDSKIGLLGIAKNYRLAPKPDTVANFVSRLFSKAEVVMTNDISVEIDPIPDPNDFLTLISTAHQVQKFTATFTGPNPNDADEYFQKPLSVYCQKAGAKGGQTTVKGDDLNRTVVMEVARSTAATGNEATARIRRESGGSLETVSMSSTEATFQVEEENHSPETATTAMLNKYGRIRNAENPVEATS